MICLGFFFTDWGLEPFETILTCCWWCCIHSFKFCLLSSPFFLQTIFKNHSFLNRLFSPLLTFSSKTDKKLEPFDQAVGSLTSHSLSLSLSFFLSCILTLHLSVLTNVLCILSLMEVFSSRRRRLYWPKQKAVVFMSNPKKLCSTCMALFNSCLTVVPIPVVHLILQKSSTSHCIRRTQTTSLSPSPTFPFPLATPPSKSMKSNWVAFSFLVPKSASRHIMALLKELFPTFFYLCFSFLQLPPFLHFPRFISTIVPILLPPSLFR